jgi:hypothetical protein
LISLWCFRTDYAGIQRLCKLVVGYEVGLIVEYTKFFLESDVRLAAHGKSPLSTSI